MSLIVKTVIKVLGVVLLLVGFAVFWSPIPVGILVIPVGAAMIVATSSHAQKWLRTQRERHHGFDRWMDNVERKVPGKISRPLEATKPHNGK